MCSIYKIKISVSQTDTNNFCQSVIQASDQTGHIQFLWNCITK